MEMQNENFLGHYAGFTSRLIAYVIDLVISFTGILVILWLFAITIEMFQVQEILAALGWGDTLDNLFDPNDDFLLRSFFLVLGMGLYQIFFLTLANRTIGKALMGLQVIPLRGGRIGLLRATLRYLGYVVSIIPLFFGFFWILGDRRRQGFHDKIAGTCVVYTWEAQPDKIFLRRGLLRLQKANEERYEPPPD